MKVKLGEVFENIINGDWGNEPTGNDDVAVIRTTNFTNNGVINYDNVVYRQIKNDVVLKKKLICGDIIIEKSGGSDNFPVGRVVYYDRIDEIYLCNNFTSILRTNKELVVSKYLLYLMLNLYKKGVTTKFQNKTTGIRNLQLTSYLTNTEINIHDIQTQKEIVSILDKVTSLISMRKEQLEKLDILVKSKFIEMFGDPVLNPKGWEKKKLGEVCEINPNKDVFKCIDNDLEVTFLPMENVSINGKVKTNIIKKYYEVKKGYSYFKENDVLFAKITPCMENGKSAVAKNLKNELGVGSTEFHVLRPKINYINSVWLYNLVHFKWFRLMAEYKMTGSAGQRRVPSTFLKNFITIIPPLELQNQFAEFVEHVEKNKENIKSSLNQLETLYNALMQEYFG